MNTVLSTQKHGWLTGFRLLWLAVVVLTLALFVAGLPAYFTKLSTPCSGDTCASGQVSPAVAVSLEEAGVTLPAYASFIIALTIFFGLTSLAFGGVIFWRRAGGWIGLFISLSLILLGMLSPVTALAEKSPSVWVPVQILNFITAVSVPLIFYLFPNGRFVPSWTRWMALLWFSMMAIDYLPFDFLPSLAFMDQIGPVLFLAFLVSFIYAQLYRYKKTSTSIEVQQTKLVVFGFTDRADNPGCPPHTADACAGLPAARFAIRRCQTSHRNFSFTDHSFGLEYSHAALPPVGYRRHYPQDAGLRLPDRHPSAGLLRRGRPAAAGIWPDQRH